MNSDDRAWVEMLRETKTSGNIGFGGRQMRRLLGIVDGLEAEAGTLVRRLVKSSAPCPENRFCVGPVRPDCEGLKKEQLCRKCYLAAAMQEKNHDRQ